MQFATSFTTPSIAAVATSSIALVLLIGATIYLTKHRRRLRHGFYFSALTSLIPVIICFSLALTGYLMLMELNSCLILKKFVYALIYINFIGYDYYQLKKVLYLTNCAGVKSWFLYFALISRIASVTFTTYHAKGLMPSTTSEGLGSCLTYIPHDVVLLEHAVSIFFELALISHFGLYFLLKYLKEKSIAEYWNVAMDFELVTFFAYSVTECLHIVAFQILPASYISTMNLIYNSLPGLLYLANGIVQLSWARKGQSTEHNSKKTAMIERTEKVIVNTAKT
ncbi:hypothetical protein BC833DRAFT_590842 [Globomyces pollinis-pini]|nr:hypothetical protein BC833DRAFT_590842 [Globomyces pollinis-pini]